MMLGDRSLPSLRVTDRSGLFLTSSSTVPELLARDYRLDQAAEGIFIRFQLRLHRIERLAVGQLQSAAQSVGEEFAAQVVDEVVLAFVAEVFAEAVGAGAFFAVGESRCRRDRLTAEVFRAALADRAEAFKDQSYRVKAVV